MPEQAMRAAVEEMHLVRGEVRNLIVELGEARRHATRRHKQLVAAIVVGAVAWAGSVAVGVDVVRDTERDRCRSANESKENDRRVIDIISEWSKGSPRNQTPEAQSYIQVQRDQAEERLDREAPITDC